MNQQLQLKYKKMEFQVGSSYVLMVTVLKETTDYYVKQGSEIHCWISNSPKVFENINGAITRAFLWCFQMQEFRHLSHIFTCAYIHFNAYQFQATWKKIYAYNYCESEQKPNPILLYVHPWEFLLRPWGLNHYTHTSVVTRTRDCS